jgi:hypothetical protein
MSLEGLEREVADREGKGGGREGGRERGREGERGGGRGRGREGSSADATSTDDGQSSITDDGHSLNQKP